MILFNLCRNINFCYFDYLKMVSGKMKNKIKKKLVSDSIIFTNPLI